MKNLIKFFLIITFTIFAKEILLGLISENLPLSWPGKVLIAPIFGLKGFYLNDFFTNAISRSSKTMSECRQIKRSPKKTGTDNL